MARIFSQLDRLDRFAVRERDGRWDVVDTAFREVPMASSPSKSVAEAIATFMGGDTEGARVQWHSCLDEHNAAITD